MRHIQVGSIAELRTLRGIHSYNSSIRVAYVQRNPIMILSIKSFSNSHQLGLSKIFALLFMLFVSLYRCLLSFLSYFSGFIVIYDFVEGPLTTNIFTIYFIIFWTKEIFYFCDYLLSATLSVILIEFVPATSKSANSSS